MDFIPSFTIFFIVSSFECSQLPGISRARQPIWRSSPGGWLHLRRESVVEAQQLRR
jgi:hypothetical protein